MSRSDYRKYLSPEIQYISYKWLAPHTLFKKIRKIRKKIQAKAIQGHVPWLRLKKNFQISFSQYANSIRTPLFRSMRQAQNTPMHSISWRCPKIVCHCDPISLLINTFSIHLEPECKVMNKSFIIMLLKMSKNKQQFCSIFRQIVINWPGRDFL